MAQVRKMNEALLDRLLKDITVRGEEIRSLQDEKQSVMDEFRKERERFRNGRISERSLMASTKKVNAELAALDLKIRRNIREFQTNAKRADIYVENQAPEKYRATHGGIIRVVKRRNVLSPKAQKINVVRKAAKARRPAKARRAARRSRRSAKRRKR